MNSCAGLHYAAVAESAGKLTVARSEFSIQRKGKVSIRKFVLVESSSVRFPICLNRISEDEYRACLLRCTHQACELNPGSEYFHCPCHGSEFSTDGRVLQGPASENLKTYPTTRDAENIYIHTI